MNQANQPSDKRFLIRTFLLNTVTLIINIFLINKTSNDDWKPILNYTAFIFGSIIVHYGFRSFTNIITPKVDIFLNIIQIIIIIGLIVFAFLQNNLLIILFSIFLLIIFFLSIYLDYKKEKNQ